MAYIPNILTLLRILSVPIVVFLVLNDQYLGAFLLFLAAGITDGLDGYIAKKYHLQSRLGALLDPLADKLLLLALFITLTNQNHIPLWFMLLAFGRDIVILVGFFALTTLRGPVEMRPLITSKIATFLQILLVSCVLLQQSQLVDIPVFNLWLLRITTVFIVISGVKYVYIWLRKYQSKSL